ncbi:hypothetical protein Acor_59900 [Acrocarpospora corrugata]|uniref:Putative restriction endonuclease domain-containing protein n=1 Tax=Acrocarpospora corrugata TaxID=35763 RepID=A0A5M3W566_9ACTN|nr:hypothetical protein Acor_59900 [Acrocarpospora corrugata]
MAEMRRSRRGDCYETNTEVDVLLWEVPPTCSGRCPRPALGGAPDLLWEVPPTARKPDVVLHRCLEEFGQLAADPVMIVAEVLSTWSGRRDRAHKMSDYADGGIPHYWIVSFDKVGAVSIERYVLAGRNSPYTHIGTTHRDMGPMAVNVTAPFPIEVLWADLAVAPQV